MNYEGTLRALLEDAGPRLRETVKSALVDALVGDQKGVLFEMLRKAYDVGYREALASQGARGPVSDSSSSEATTPVGSTGTAEPAESVAVGPTSVGEALTDNGEADDEAKSDIDWDALDDDEEGGNGSVQDEDHEHADIDDEVRNKFRVRKSLSIGSLRSRIVRLFELERFDIDVVICRRGDRSRRQLKATAKLGKYQAE